ncbi:MAG: hypothetical protein Q9221_002302 [Calogaya cf. arnoldii]
MIFYGATLAPILPGKIQPVSISAQLAKVRKQHLATERPHPYGRDFADIPMALYACADGSYCCGTDDKLNKACCEGHNGVFVKNGRVVSSLNANSPTSTPPSSTTSIPAGPATPSPNSRSSKTGPIVGGVVGGMAGIAVLAMAFWYLVLRRKFTRQQDQSGLQDQSPQQKPRQHNYERIYTVRQDTWQEPKELPEDDLRRELDSRPRQELEGHKAGGS